MTRDQRWLNSTNVCGFENCIGSLKNMFEDMRIVHEFEKWLRIQKMFLDLKSVHGFGNMFANMKKMFAK